MAEMTAASSTYTSQFCGWLDYIFASPGLALATRHPAVPEDVLSQHVAIPSAAFPSDHCPVVARYTWAT